MPDVVLIGRDLGFDAFAPAHVNLLLPGEFVAQGQPGRGERLRVARGLGAIGEGAGAIESGVAQAEPGAPLRRQVDAVARVELRAALGAVGIGVVIGSLIMAMGLTFYFN